MAHIAMAGRREKTANTCSGSYKSFRRPQACGLHPVIPAYCRERQTTLGCVRFVWTVCHYSTANVRAWLTTGTVVQVFLLSKVAPADVSALSDAVGPALP